MRKAFKFFQPYHFWRDLELKSHRRVFFSHEDAFKLQAELINIFVIENSIKVQDQDILLPLASRGHRLNEYNRMLEKSRGLKRTNW